MAIVVVLVFLSSSSLSSSLSSSSLSHTPLLSTYHQHSPSIALTITPPEPTHSTPPLPLAAPESVGKITAEVLSPEEIDVSFESEADQVYEIHWQGEASSAGPLRFHVNSTGRFQKKITKLSPNTKYEVGMAGLPSVLRFFLGVGGFFVFHFHFSKGL